MIEGPYPKCGIHHSLQKKIEHIHECVVNGDLEELQSALTRRKMALSRDDKESKDLQHYAIDGFTYITKNNGRTISGTQIVSLVKSGLSLFSGPRAAAQGRFPGTWRGGQVARGAVPGDGGS